jgi:non-ribosomal peptide synthetase component F
MVADAAPVVVLTSRALAPLLAATAVTVVALEEVAWTTLPATAPARDGLTLDHLAYLIYTSGSTGTPKGVMVAHRNVVRLFTATEAWFAFGPADVWSLFHSSAFDFSVWELWGALLYGGRLIVVSQEMARSPNEFYRLVCRQQVTILNQTPSAFRQLQSAQA